MPTVVSDALDHSLVELANRMQGKKMQDILVKFADNEILGDLRWKEANGGTKHKESTMEDLPRGEFGPLGGFYGSGKATSRQVEEEVHHMKLYSKVPVDVAKLSGNPARYRKTEDEAVVEGLSQQAAEEIFYGSGDADVWEPRGLSNRLNALSMANVLDAGGTSGSDGLTSIYLIKQDPRAFFGIYRQGIPAGLNVRDLGEENDLDTSTGKERRVYKTLFEWEMGFMVRDPRVVYRIANVPVPNSVLDETAFAKWNHLLIQALNKIPNKLGGSLRIYCNSDVISQWDIMTFNRDNVYYNPASPDGKKPADFRGVPIRRVDALLSTEDQVS